MAASPCALPQTLPVSPPSPVGPYLPYTLMSEVLTSELTTAQNHLPFWSPVTATCPSPPQRVGLPTARTRPRILPEENSEDRDPKATARTAAHVDS